METLLELICKSLFSIGIGIILLWIFSPNPNWLMQRHLSGTMTVSCGQMRWVHWSCNRYCSQPNTALSMVMYKKSHTQSWCLAHLLGQSLAPFTVADMQKSEGTLLDWVLRMNKSVTDNSAAKSKVLTFEILNVCIQDFIILLYVHSWRSCLITSQYLLKNVRFFNGSLLENLRCDTLFFAYHWKFSALFWHKWSSLV